VSEHLQIRVYRTLDELQTLLPAWEELLAAYPPSTTFSTWEWLSSWWRAFGENQQLLVLAFRDCNSRLVALAPLSIAPRQIARGLRLRELRLMGDGSGDSDNLDMPVRPGFENQFVASFLDYLAKERRVWDFCGFNTLPANSPALKAWLNYLHQQRWPVFDYSRVASAICMPESWEAYLQQLSSENRKNLERYSRRLGKRYRSQIYRCTRESQLQVCLEALFRLHQARWQAAGEQGTFASQARRNFYYELSRALLARDWLELWVLELDGVIAAVQYAFRYERTVFQLQEGVDPARSSDRLGFVLRGHIIKELIAQGVRNYDFLGGELGYKASWAAQMGSYVNLEFARPFSLGSAYLRTLHDARKGKEWLRVHLPTSAWEVLHKINIGRNGTPSKSQAVSAITVSAASLESPASSQSKESME
jgi:CelD/BcsL family acetyltransferase involved in cellulose biosynthesis